MNTHTKKGHPVDFGDIRTATVTEKGELCLVVEQAGARTAGVTFSFEETLKIAEALAKDIKALILIAEEKLIAYKEDVWNEPII